MAVYGLQQAHYPGRAPIDAYGNGGFRFAEMSHRGGLMLTPSGIYGWEQPKSPRDLGPASIERVLQEADRIEVLLVGTGLDLVLLPPALKKAVVEASISTDPMSTGAAVRTYNVLLAEDRAVAAILFPVD